MSHLFWHIHDPSHPRHQCGTGDCRSDRAMLMELDEDRRPPRCRGRRGLRDRCGLDRRHSLRTTIGRIWSTRFCGVSTIPSTAPAVPTESFRALWNRVPHPVQKSLFGLRHHFREQLMERDRRKRRAFALPLNERAGGVRINLAGREPNGLVAAGAEYDAVCQEPVGGFRGAGLHANRRAARPLGGQDARRA